MKHGPWTTAPSSIFAPSAITASFAPANGAAEKAPLMMSRCTWVYFSGVPMSIQ